MRKPGFCADCGQPATRERCTVCGAKRRHRINRFRLCSNTLVRIGKILSDIRTYVERPTENLDEGDHYIVSAHSLAADLDRIEKEYAQFVNEGMVDIINQHLNKEIRAVS